MPMLSVPGGEIHYEVHAAKGSDDARETVLLFAPGFLSSRIERWRSNPARPGVAQDWLDPIEALSPGFQLIALDVRNAGRSRVQLTDGDGWHSYTADHLALLDHVGVARCHIFGACIGVSHALALANAATERVNSLVLQNPIGASDTNRDALDGEFKAWAEGLEGRPDATQERLRAFQQAMFGGDFIFSVDRDFVRRCEIPMLLMPGNDLMHAKQASDDLARAPRIQIIDPWKGPLHKGRAMQRVREFLKTNRATP